MRLRIRGGMLVVLLGILCGDIGGKPPEYRIAGLIKQLGDEDFDRREAASKALDSVMPRRTSRRRKHSRPRSSRPRRTSWPQPSCRAASHCVCPSR